MSRDNIRDDLDQYWATKPAFELADECNRRVSEQYNLFDVRESYSKIIRTYSHYYGKTNEAISNMVVPAGERGELTLTYVNFIRYFVSHILSMIAGDRLAYQCVPVNTDVRAKEQSILGNEIMRYYVKNLRLHKVLREATEFALVCSEGYVLLEWDEDAGDEYGVGIDESANLNRSVKGDGALQPKILKTGDVSCKTFSYLDVTRDEAASRNDGLNWMIIREWVNRWDLVAKFPSMKDDILRGGTKRDEVLNMRGVASMHGTTDYIALYKFFHAKTPALPSGREMWFVNGDTCLKDRPLPYREIPIYRVAPSDVLGTPRGYTPVYDLMGPCAAANLLINTGLSNMAALGTVNLYARRGSGITASMLNGGLNLIEGDLEPPVPLQLAQNPPDLLNMVELFHKYMMEIVGTNPASLGYAEQRLSGEALALLDSKATQFVAPLSESYTFLAERVGQAIFDMVRDFSVGERTFRMIGKNKLPYARSFQAQDIADVDLVQLETTNPLNQTPAMKMQDANVLLQQGMISTQEYFQVKETGMLEDTAETQTSEKLLVKRENEMLLQGVQPPVILTDDHVFHIKGHNCNLSDPEVRGNPQVVQSTLAHLMEHIQQLLSMPAPLAMALGHTLPGMPLPGGAPAPTGGAAPEGPPLPEPSTPPNPQT